MTDELALYIVLFGAVVLAVAKILSRGNYDERFYLDAGCYEAGVDIDPGKGDLLAISGAGNFCVKNKMKKEWTIGNNIGATSGFQPKQFRNLALNNGDILEINGSVVVLVSPPVPIKDPSEEALCPGTYRFSVDVPAGKYDLEVVSGDGDVLLVEVGKDNYTFFQDMSASNPIKADSFKNVVCTKAHELWISGSLQIKLIPSHKKKKKQKEKKEKGEKQEQDEKKE